MKRKIRFDPYKEQYLLLEEKRIFHNFDRVDWVIVGRTESDTEALQFLDDEQLIREEI